MAWTTPGTATAGSVLTASWLNTNVRDNLNMVAPVMSAWTSYTPTIAQGATGNIAKTIEYSKYMQIGKLVVASFRLAVTGAGTGNNIVTVSLPVTAAYNGATVGTGNIFNAGASYGGQWLTNSTTTVLLIGDWSGTGGFGTAPNTALANGNYIHGFVSYEAA